VKSISTKDYQLSYIDRYSTKNVVSKTFMEIVKEGEFNCQKKLRM